MNGLKLYKVLATDDNKYETALSDEIRWINNEKLLVWIPYMWIDEFINEIKEMFGITIFDEGGFNGNFQEDCICIDLEETIGYCDIDLKSIFPFEKYSI